MKGFSECITCKEWESSQGREVVRVSSFVKEAIREVQDIQAEVRGKMEVTCVWNEMPKALREMMENRV